MEKIKHYLNIHFYTLFPLVAITAISLFTLMIRLKLTQSFFFLFLVWNLFLAFIPFMISFTLKQYQKPSKTTVAIASFVWLLFLPNAPYIITDLIHLQHSESKLLWFDAFLIGVFSVGGMLCYLQSMFEMETIAARFLAKRYIKLLLLAIPFLTGFGIYLGRFLRFNSWDILQNPLSLIAEIAEIIVSPNEHIEAWVVTLGFGCILLISNLLYKNKARKKQLIVTH